MKSNNVQVWANALMLATLRVLRGRTPSRQGLCSAKECHNSCAACCYGFGNNSDFNRNSSCYESGNILRGVANSLAVICVIMLFISIVTAQSPVQKLEQGGRLSFRLNDSPYYVRVGTGCSQPYASGGIGAQSALCIPLSDLNRDGVALDFQVTINQLINYIQSDELITFVGTPIAVNRVRWVADRVFNPPHCAFISGLGIWVRITRFYADFTMEISVNDSQRDPYGCLCGDLVLSIFGNTQGNENVNYIGFEGQVMYGGRVVVRELQYKPVHVLILSMRMLMVVRIW